MHCSDFQPQSLTAISNRNRNLQSQPQSPTATAISNRNRNLLPQPQSPTETAISYRNRNLQQEPQSTAISNHNRNPQPQAHNFQPQPNFPVYNGLQQPQPRFAGCGCSCCRPEFSDICGLYQNFLIFKTQNCDSAVACVGRPPTATTNDLTADRGCGLESLLFMGFFRFRIGQWLMGQPFTAVLSNF